MLQKIILTLALAALPVAAHAQTIDSNTIPSPYIYSAENTNRATASQNNTVTPPPPRVRTNRANTPWERRTAINQRRTERRVKRTADNQLERTRDMQRQQDAERQRRNSR